MTQLAVYDASVDAYRVLSRWQSVKTRVWYALDCPPRVTPMAVLRYVRSQH